MFLDRSFENFRSPKYCNSVDYRTVQYFEKQCFDYVWNVENCRISKAQHVISVNIRRNNLLENWEFAKLIHCLIELHLHDKFQISAKIITHRTHPLKCRKVLHRISHRSCPNPIFVIFCGVVARFLRSIVLPNPTCV